MKGKGISKRLKKIFVAYVIFCVLSNYIAILGNVCNIAYASSEAMKITRPIDELILDRGNNKEKNEVQEAELENVLEENIETNTVIEDAENQGEKLEIVDETLDEELLENELENVLNQENEIIDPEATEENLEQNVEEEVFSDVYQLEDVEVFSELTVNEFIQTQNLDNKGAFIEAVLKFEFEKKDLPIEVVNISLDLPKVNELIPENINIDTDAPWVIDEENEKINIFVENLENFGEQVSLEYKLKLIYTGDIYEIDNLKLNGVVTIASLEEQIEREITCIAKGFEVLGGNFVNLEATSENASIYKGYLKANVIAEIKNETKYDVVKKVKITNSDIIEVIELQAVNEKIISKAGKEYEFLNRYEKTLVSVAEFEKIFANDGYIEIYTKEGFLVGKIDKESKKENDYYVFEYTEDVNEVVFKLINPVANGEISLKNKKAILDSNVFSAAEVESFNSIKTNMTGKAVKTVDDREIILQENNFENEIMLQQTESKMTLSIDNNNLSTDLENEVVMTVTLKTDEEKYELFKNPSIEIKLPSEVTDVKINTINLLYKNGLTIDSYDVVTDEFGNKAISVNLLGTQKEYMPSLPNIGSTIVIYTTVVLNRLSTNQKSKYELRYDNEIKSNLSYELKGKDCEDFIVKFVSKPGLLRALRLTNISTLESIISYDNESSELLVKEHTNTQAINYKGTIVNNFNTDLTNVVIVGKIPTQGATDGNLNRLETTFDMTLNSPIVTNGLTSKVYYSENVNANKDDLSWEEDISDLRKYKAFKIVIENEVVKQGESLEFSLNMKVPSGLDYNNKAYVTYTAYYGLNGQELLGTSTDKILTEEKELTIEDFSNEEIEEVAELSFSTIASQGGTRLTEEDTVFERQIVDYTVFVKNTSNVPVRNIKIKADVHNSNLYYKYIFESDEYDLTNMVTYFYYKEDTDNSKQFEEFTIDSLAPGETASFTYQCIADEISDNGEKEIYSSIKVSADDIEETSLETIKNKVKNTKVSLKLEWAFRQIVGDIDAYAGDGLKYRIYYKNISNETLKDQVVYFTVPNTVRYTGGKIEGAEDFKVEEIETSEGLILAITVPEIKEGEELNFYVSLISNEFDIEKQSVDMSYLAYTYVGDEQVKSNKYVQKCYQDKTKIKYTFVVDKEENVILKDGDEVIYTLTMENVGNILSDYNELSTELPKGLKLEKIYLTKKGERNEIQITNDKKFIITEENFEPNDILKLEVVTKFYKDFLSYDQKTVEVQMAIDGGVAYDKFYTNVISLDVENDKVTVYEEEVMEDENGDEITGENEGTPPPILEEPKEDDKTEENKEEQTNNNEDINDDSSNNNNNNNNDNNSSNNGNDNNVNNNSNQGNKPSTENSGTSNSSSNSNSNNSTSQKEPTVTTKKTYRINGKAWLDKNKDGKYESGEEILSNIKVTAYQVDTNKGKVEDGKVKGTTKTSTEGTYVFTGLENGHYVLVFEYDTEMYSPTQYEAKNVPTSVNSDVIAKEMAKTNQKVAMTDTLEIKDNTLTNIDIGLVLNNEFDLTVSKFVEKAIVNNSKGNKETKFDRDELVKLEIHSKMFESSTVKVVYKIVVENNGDIDAFVNEITDIIPKGTTFKSEENTGWHQNSDGKLVYTGLIGKTIKAGERKEVTLILYSDDNTVATKQLENTVELTEISNKKGQDDIDLSNNKAKVELLIIPSTGKVINNTLIVICVIAIVTVIVVIVLNKDKFKRNYK